VGFSSRPGRGENSNSRQFEAVETYADLIEVGIKAAMG